MIQLRLPAYIVLDVCSTPRVASRNLQTKLDGAIASVIVFNSDQVAEYVTSILYMPCLTTFLCNTYVSLRLVLFESASAFCIEYFFGFGIATSSIVRIAIYLPPVRILSTLSLRLTSDVISRPSRYRLKLPPAV